MEIHDLNLQEVRKNVNASLIPQPQAANNALWSMAISPLVFKWFLKILKAFKYYKYTYLVEIFNLI